MATKGVGSKWAFGLGNKGYMLSTLDQQAPFEFRSYAIEPISLRVPRIDLSSEPGEQSIGSLWPRAQHSFHEGAGQAVFDSEFSSRFKFEAGGGIDPFQRGALAIAPICDYTAALYQSMIVVGDSLAGLRTGGAEIRKLINGDPNSSEGVLSSISGMVMGPHKSASDGKNLYVSNATDIYQVDMTQDFSGSPTGTVVNLLGAVDAMGFVKGRLMVGIGTSLHEITDLTDTANGATAIWDHISEAWEFTVFEETGPGIYAAGFAGEISELLFINLNASDLSAGVTLGVPTVAWRAPSNEHILSLSAYSGTAMLMGTSRGLRNVLVSGEGEVRVSPLIVETPVPCVKVEAGAEFGYFTYGPYDGDTDNGYLGKIDLSNLGWVLYLRAVVGGSGSSMVDLVLWDEMPVFLDSSTKIWFPATAGRVNDAWLETGEIRFGTSENKFMRKMDVVFDQSQSGLNILDEEDIVLSSADMAIDQFAGNTERVIEALVFVEDMSLSGFEETHLVTHGNPYGTADSNDDPEEIFWILRLGDLSSIAFRYRTGLNTWALIEANNSYWFAGTPNLHWIKVIFDSDGGEINFYVADDLDGEPDTYSLFSTETITLPLYKITPSISYPLFMGGKGPTDAAPVTGDFIYKVRVWEDLAQTYQTVDWDSSNPYVDSQGSEYSVEPRAYNSTGKVWETYTPSEANDPYSRIRLTNGITSEIFIQIDEGGWTSMGNFSGRMQQDLGIIHQGSRVKLRFEFSHNLPGVSGDLERSLLEWRIRAEPIPTPRYLQHFVPIMLFDRMNTLDGHPIDREGWASSELDILRSHYRRGSLLTFEPPDHGESVLVRIDGLRFKEFAPPKGAKGFGGICLLILKEQE